MHRQSPCFSFKAVDQEKRQVIYTVRLSGLLSNSWRVQEVLSKELT